MRMAVVIANIILPQRHGFLETRYEAIGQFKSHAGSDRLMSSCAQVSPETTPLPSSSQQQLRPRVQLAAAVVAAQDLDDQVSQISHLSSPVELVPAAT